LHLAIIRARRSPMKSMWRYSTSSKLESRRFAPYIFHLLFCFYFSYSIDRQALVPDYFWHSANEGRFIFLNNWTKVHGDCTDVGIKCSGTNAELGKLSAHERQRLTAFFFSFFFLGKERTRVTGADPRSGASRLILSFRSLWRWPDGDQRPRLRLKVIVVWPRIPSNRENRGVNSRKLEQTTHPSSVTTFRRSSTFCVYIWLAFPVSRIHLIEIDATASPGDDGWPVDEQRWFEEPDASANYSSGILKGSRIRAA